jgi:hypothetical protein
MTEYLLDKVSGAAAVGQVDDLAEGDTGCLGADLPAVLAPQLRSTTTTTEASPPSAPPKSRDQREERSS